ncbi:MAG: tyrosine--tRNA ligase, partial [Candidatus Bathyarchaeia archaeon]
GIAEPAKLKTRDKLEQVIASKMSKSKPWTAIFIHDTEEQIRAKLKKAWCPEKQTEMNPVLEIVKYVIFHESKAFTVERPSKFGGTITFESYEELEEAYRSGALHPQDLKNAVAKDLTKILEPIRRYFENNSEARECLNTVLKAQVTR